MNGQVGRADAVYIAHCPLAACAWRSDPLTSLVSAHEATRAHIDGHSHADLVDYICFKRDYIERYNRQGQRPGGEPEHGDAKLGY